MTIQAFAPGKMILSGEYAVVFGYPGIAVPTTVGVQATFEEDGTSPIKIVLKGLTGDEAYAHRIVDACIEKGGKSTGTLTIDNQIPVGRGMGSSTALVVAICKCLLGEQKRPEAIMIEDVINPGNSGLDFAVIWINRPVTFKKGTTPDPIHLDLGFLKTAKLIDTGKPGETTAELVAWMTLHYTQDDKTVVDALKKIGNCTERLLAGEDIKTVMRDHHQAQIALGAVRPYAQELIEHMETTGGSGKVLGAGARTGGGGMVLVLQ